MIFVNKYVKVCKEFLFLIIWKTSFITIASDPSILAVLEKVIKTSFLFNFSNTLEDIAVKTQLCFSHFLTCLAPITIGYIGIYFRITRQGGMPFLTVSHSSELLRHKTLPLFIMVNSVLQLPYIFIIVDLL